MLADRMMPVAIRLGPDTAIIRTDVDCPALAHVAGERGLVLVAREPPLATVVALQRVGHSAALWDLWATDTRTAASLLAAAT